MPSCENCGGTDIDFDTSRGDAVCIQCGTVLEENTIVNEVTFAQDAGGGSSVVGQFVAATPGAASAGLGFSKESREVAYSNGQRHISQLAAALRLAEHHQEAAQRLFMLAVQHNFIQGRRTQNVIAACMYTVCRREKTPHMLIDFSDVLQTNVYMLGSCFLKFTRLLSLTLPIIDPSLYIHRFASKLELGDKTHLVSMSALRLVQRMRRDWIQTGRRPSGICGAALLIASRVHGFRRTQREVVRIVRICDAACSERHLASATAHCAGLLGRTHKAPRCAAHEPRSRSGPKLTGCGARA
jgi:transcription factor IIIB subunit 2